MFTASASMGALRGLRVVDFSTLLPGPLCSLMLAACGAEVIKVERPGGGDEMRGYGPLNQGQSLPFALLNMMKRTVELDLKSEPGRAEALALIAQADVLIEQFRPGVMERLGLGFEAAKAVNPRLIYCSITGYGQHGPRAQAAGHDLNFQALTGMLSLSTDAQGTPVLPPVPYADMAGGTYPALINILLALQQRQHDDAAVHLDISMAGSLPTLMNAPLAEVQVPDYQSPRAFSGGSPRYAIYQTADQRHLAVAAVEDRFWRRLCALLHLPEDADHAALQSCIGQHHAAHWQALLEGEEVCCTVVRSVAEFAASEEAPKPWAQVRWGDRTMAAIPLPLHASFLGER